MVFISWLCPLFGQENTKIEELNLPQGVLIHLRDYRQFKPLPVISRSTCGLYEEIVKAYREGLGVEISKIRCSSTKYIKSIEDIHNRVGDEVCLRMNYGGVFNTENNSYVLLVYQLYSDDYSNCIGDFLLFKLEDEVVVIDDVPSYISNRDFFSLRVVDPDLIHELVEDKNFNVQVDSISEVALSLDKFSNKSGQKTKYFMKCGYPRQSKVQSADFHLIANLTEQQPVFSRKRYLGDTLTFDPEYRKHAVDVNWVNEYKNSRDILYAFMMAYSPETLLPLYYTESDGPSLGYNFMKDRSGEGFYSENLLIPLYSTKLKNAYDLPLSAIVFNVVRKGMVSETRALVLINEIIGTPRIFTSFGEYPKLLSEITFELSANFDYVEYLAGKRLGEVGSKLDRKLWSAGRRPGEKYFDITLFEKYFTLLDDQSIEYRRITTNVSVFTKGKFW